MSGYEVKNMKKEYTEEAAELFASGYREEREGVEWLPKKYEDPDNIKTIISNIIEDSPGIAVFENGSMKGYKQGVSLSTSREKRSMYIPEWGHTAVNKDQLSIYQIMYENAASRWVKNGYFKHLISFFSNDKEIKDTFSWFGFGMTTVDPVRGVDGIEANDIDCQIREVEKEDAEKIHEFRIDMDRYTASSPIFLPYEKKPDLDYYENYLQDDSTKGWFALDDGEPVSYILLGKPSDCAYVIHDENSININGAYTKKGFRRKGIGTKLLSKAVQWAEEKGYRRVTVDFEPENILGRNFWLKYFKPVCYSMVRNVDEIIAWANARRDLKDIW